MTEHPSRERLAAFRARRLPAREMLATDDHLADCAACRAALAAAARPAATRRLVAGIAPPPHADHLAFERIEAYVDGALGAADRAAVEAHLGRCMQCAREVAVLSRVAPALARRAAPVEPARTGAWSRFTAWLGGPTGMRAAFAVLVAAVAIAWLVPQQLGREPDDSAMRSVAPRTERGRFDESALARASRDSLRLYRAGDYAGLLAELKTLDARGDAIARTALGVAYALGLGVPADPAQAERLWLDAAARGERSAAHNLGVLYERGMTGTPDPQRAEEWYGRASCEASRGYFWTAVVGS